MCRRDRLATIAHERPRRSLADNRFTRRTVKVRAIAQLANLDQAIATNRRHTTRRNIKHTMRRTRQRSRRPDAANCGARRSRRNQLPIAIFTRVQLFIATRRRRRTLARVEVRAVGLATQVPRRTQTDDRLARRTAEIHAIANFVAIAPAIATRRRRRALIRVERSTIRLAIKRAARSLTNQRLTRLVVELRAIASLAFLDNPVATLTLDLLLAAIRDVFVGIEIRRRANDLAFARLAITTAHVVFARRRTRHTTTSTVVRVRLRVDAHIAAFLIIRRALV